ncbi:hypothetical protein NUSPORA_02814 [Nucleospora cyclopteri]
MAIFDDCNQIIEIFFKLNFLLIIQKLSINYYYYVKMHARYMHNYFKIINIYPDINNIKYMGLIYHNK